MLSRILSISILSLSALASQAIPAYPGKNKVQQPDGTELELVLIGDEHSHATVTVDGYTVIECADGFYRYALQTADGGIGVSDFKATPEANRTAEVKALLGKTPKRLHAPMRNRKASPSVAFPTRGDLRSLVFLVDFRDVPFVTPDVHREFDEMLNLPGFDRREHIGSAADYFRAQSMGNFRPNFDVYGPIRATQPATYYGENDGNGDDKYVWELVLEACRALDGEIDFSNYDYDGDGRVDNIYIFYAGYGENFAGNKSSWIWPHAAFMSEYGINVSDRTFDGVVVDSYGCASELYGSTGSDVAAIGTFCHEFGHILGLPDTYDVNYGEDGSSAHPDQWDIMASGSYLPATRNCGAVPAGYSGVERWLLGWSEPVDISKPQSVKLPDLQSSNLCVRISTEDPDEFYILENRQNTSGSYDRYLPSHGMLIWHVDRRKDARINVTTGGLNVSISPFEAWSLQYNALNCNATHPCLEIEKASGNDGSKSSLDTPWPGRQMRTEFTDATNPSMRTWAGTAVGKPVTGIKESNGVISFDYIGGDSPMSVTTLCPENVGPTGFTARWTTDNRADAYRLYVYSVEKSVEHDSELLSATFTSLPELWSGEDVTYSSSGATIGEKAAGKLISPAISLVNGGKLTIKANRTSSDAATLTVKYGETTITTYQPTQTSSNISITIPAGLPTGSITLSATRRKPVTVASISLTGDKDVSTYTLLPGYPVETGPEGSYAVTGLEGGMTYAYSAETKGYVASMSDRREVVTSDHSSVSPTEVMQFDADAEVTVTDLSGRTVMTAKYGDYKQEMVGRGFYIVTIRDKNQSYSYKILSKGL